MKGGRFGASASLVPFFLKKGWRGLIYMLKELYQHHVSPLSDTSIAMGMGMRRNPLDMKPNARFRKAVQAVKAVNQVSGRR
jgi:hypothetical protein